MKRSTPLARSGFKKKIRPDSGLFRTASLGKPLQRKLPILSAGVKPKNRIATLNDLKKIKKASRKAAPAHEEAHCRAVAALPCANCGIQGYSQCAHSNRKQDGKGMGKKAHYLATFPLCCTRPGVVGCHVEHDQCIGMTRDEADSRTDHYITDTHQKLGLEQ